jgi:hypothetical protein
VFSTRFRVPWNAAIGDVIDVTVTVEDVETETRGVSFVSRFKIKSSEAVDEPNPPGGRSMDAKRQPNRNGKHSGPALELPRPLEVRKEAWDTRTPSFDEFTAIQVCNDGSGGYDLYINMDNAYLLTELTRTRDADKPLVKFWFKYGLMLCAMGMLQDERRREAKRRAPGEDRAVPDDGGLEPINRYCTGLARIIIPVIRRLYRGPEFESGS